MRKLLLFLGVITSSNLIFAQLSDEEFETILNDEDIVILKEDMKVSFVGQKTFYIQIVVEKEIEYQLLTDKGNEYLKPCILPLKFDEVYSPHSSAVRNEIRLFDDVEISVFEATVLRTDGTWEGIDVTKEIHQHRVVTETERFGQLFSHHYTFRDILPGEVVKIKFNYSFPFKYNFDRLFSTRVFLDTKIPRKNFDLTWSHQYYLEIDTSYVNGATPKMDTLNNYVYHSWHFENQPGCIDEPGSRPYTQVPWFTFTPKPYEFLYEHYNSFKEEFVPFWYFLSFNREARIRSAVVDFQIGSKDKDNLKFEKIAEKFIGMTPDDSTGVDRLRYFQRYVVDSTVYNNAFKFYNREEEYKRDHSGLELYGGLIKESNKEFIYASILPKLGQMFFTAYPSDSRSGQISQDYYAPMLDNEMMFAAVLNNNSLAYLFPKSDKRNLYCEELPFYYENSPVMLLFTYDYAGYKRNFAEVIRLIDLPGSTAKDNSRKVQSMAKVNISEGLISFNTRISLAGQYSTLTRFVYNGGPIDSTINQIYHEKVWDFGDEPTLDKIDVSKTDYFFPFKTNVNASYSHKGLVTKKDDIIELDISGWIKHVIINNFSPAHRFTDFYPDFSGNDTYSYLIEFDEPVSISDAPENIDIDNGFGIYTFSIQQIEKNKLLLNSYFLTKPYPVKKESITQVSQVYNAIEKNNHATIKVVKLP